MNLLGRRVHSTYPGCDVDKTGMAVKGKIFIGKFVFKAHVLEEFQVFAGQRNIQPSVGEWATERGWVQSRLKQEIFNQTLGVANGDEVEAQRDPVVRAAIEQLVTRL